MIVAPEALNRLVAHLCESGTGGNMNLLLSFTAWAFHLHNDIEVVGHGCFLRPADSSTPRISVSRYCPAFFKGIPCQSRRQFSPLRQATSRLSTKILGTRLAVWRRKIPNLLLMPAELLHGSLGPT